MKTSSKRAACCYVGTDVALHGGRRMTDGSPSPGLMLTHDLFFSSKVAGTARALGYRVDVESQPSQVAARLAADDYRCVIVDLALPGLDLDAIIPLVLQKAAVRVLAFGSHVETERFEAARRAGCHDVLPRSRFSATLPDLLRELLGGGP